jgi:hypothetical protein
VVSDVVWSDFDIGLLANTEARLSIFYSDFVYDADQKPIIERPPKVDLNILQRATEQLETLLKSFTYFRRHKGLASSRPAHLCPFERVSPDEP